MKMYFYKHSSILGCSSTNRLYTCPVSRLMLLFFIQKTAWVLSKTNRYICSSFTIRPPNNSLFKAITKHDLVTELLQDADNLSYVCITGQIPLELMRENSALMIPSKRIRCWEWKDAPTILTGVVYEKIMCRQKNELFSREYQKASTQV